ncbi:hypothetical protein BH10ACI3_BH10ACI3_06850 [soil metagenome]
MKHIEFARLIDRFEGRLSVEHETEITQHLSTCGECSAESAKLATFFAYSRPEETYPVPQAVTATLLNIYLHRPATAEAPAKRSILSGLLVFDDWTMALNERYSGIDSRQLLYRVGEYDVDLRLDFAGELCGLAGQVLPEFPNGEITISTGENTYAATLNEFGEFTFETVPQGIYDITIASATDELRLEKVALHR